MRKANRTITEFVMVLLIVMVMVLVLMETAVDPVGLSTINLLPFIDGWILTEYVPKHTTGPGNHFLCF